MKNLLNWLRRRLPFAPAAPKSSPPHLSDSEKDGDDAPVSAAERDRKTLIMGVDFGTAFSKIAIRAPYEPEGEEIAYPVDFGEFCEGKSFLTPTRLARASAMFGV